MLTGRYRSVDMLLALLERMEETGLKDWKDTEDEAEYLSRIAENRRLQVEERKVRGKNRFVERMAEERKRRDNKVREQKAKIEAARAREEWKNQCLQPKPRPTKAERLMVKKKSEADRRKRDRPVEEANAAWEKQREQKKHAALEISTDTNMADTKPTERTTPKEQQITEESEESPDDERSTTNSVKKKKAWRHNRAAQLHLPHFLLPLRT